MNATEGDTPPNTSAEVNAASGAAAVGAGVGDGVEVDVGARTMFGSAGSKIGTDAAVGDGVWVWTRIGAATSELFEAETVSCSR